jgi:hypothetical protein
MKKFKQAFNKKSNKDTQLQIPPTPPKAQPAPAMQPSPPRLQPQPYHHIPLGSGGIISLKPSSNPAQSTTYVGTTGTLDTVGVLFEISSTQCFAAHIEAYTTRSSSAERHYSLNFESASKLRSEVIARLDKTVPGQRTKRMRDTLVMTCTRLSGQDARASEVVAKAVREWLDAGLSGGGRVAVAGIGFVGGWPAAGHVVFEREPGEGWTAVKCDVGEREWSFGVVENEVEGSEETW